MMSDYKKVTAFAPLIATIILGGCMAITVVNYVAPTYEIKAGEIKTTDDNKQEENDVIGVGKINDIFCGEGITQTYHSDSSVHGMQQTIDICKKDFHGLCFVNLVDFDALWGHRRNPEGYGREIEKFDSGLGTLMNELREDDLLILTADHGNDPTYTGTDHTREYVPCLIYGKEIKAGVNLHTRKGFADMAATIAEALGSKYRGDGESFWDEIRN